MMNCCKTIKVMEANQLLRKAAEDPAHILLLRKKRPHIVILKDFHAQVSKTEMKMRMKEKVMIKTAFRES